MARPNQAQPRRGRRVSTAGLVLTGAIAVLAAGLALAWPGRGDRDQAPAAAVTTDAYASVLPGLCRSSAAAGDGDVTSAEQIFTDTLHGPLHDLAAETATSDRPAAARLLEAKQAVERDLGRSPSDPAVLAQDLARLSETTGVALGLTGHPNRPACRR